MSKEVLTGMAIALIAIVIIYCYAAPLYAQAITDGRDTEAGIWAWLRFSF